MGTLNKYVYKCFEEEEQILAPEKTIKKWFMENVPLKVKNDESFDNYIRDCGINRKLNILWYVKKFNQLFEFILSSNELTTEEAIEKFFDYIIENELSENPGKEYREFLRDHLYFKKFRPKESLIEKISILFAYRLQKKYGKDIINMK